jgi:xylan 1,4-beta-xylosidase
MTVQIRAMRLRILFLAALLLQISCSVAQSGTSTPPSNEITIDATAKGTPFPHFWEQMFGSGRAALSLRESYRKDLRTVKKVTDFRYVRFHAIFHDELGLFHLDAAGQPVYNFSYIDQVYDGLLENGVRPFVELSFMPQDLASDPEAGFQPFFYKPNTSPPKDYGLWDQMLQALARHLIERYGIDEVSQWYFEVWNEPNIGFWSGVPKQQTYVELYDHSARALKRVDTRLRVGGPSTAGVGWTGSFLAHCKEAAVPIDFLSSHVYGNDSPKDVFGISDQVPQDQTVCRAVRKVHEDIAKSPFPSLPYFLSEFNATWKNQPDITDTVYMGPWLADTVRQCDGMVQMTSYWTFSDVFEESGVVKTPFYGGFGLIAEDNIPKPAFNAFALLHKLGETRLRNDSESMLVTRRADGALVIAAWNYAEPYGSGPAYSMPPSAPGKTRSFTLKLRNSDPAAGVTAWRVDQDHGNVLRAYDAMGRPPFPTREQISALRIAGQMARPEHYRMSNGILKVDVPPRGLMLLEIPSGGKSH